MKLYEAELSVLLRMLICAAYWVRPEQQSVLLRSFKRIADQSGPESDLVI